jgi:hypothetical protein
LNAQKGRKSLLGALKVGKKLFRANVVRTKITALIVKYFIL